MTRALVVRPPGSSRVVTADTVPDTLACTGRGHELIAVPDYLPDLHMVPHLHHRLARRAQMLGHGDGHLARAAA